MDEDGMYGSRAEYYDPIYHWKDYAAESAAIRTRLADLGISGGAELLEAGCGTGSHLVHLKDHFAVRGFDLNEGMLAIARNKLPGIELFRADMAELAEDSSADAILSLFGGIAYVHPLERLQATARAFHRAVRPGGAILVEPFLTADKFKGGTLHMHTYDGADLKLCRISRAKKDGDDAEIIFHWIAVRPDGAEHFTDTHHMWLIPTATLAGAFEDAGFEVKFDDEGLMPGRGLLIGRRRA
jgi:ubiquinone/menaquinone biosynthesis C-methylase UbiE